MFKVVIISLCITLFAFAQVNMVARFNNLRYKFIEKWTTNTRNEQTSVGGYWTLSDPLIFNLENENIVEEVDKYIKFQYNPDGYEFSKVINVTQQSVYGFNYEFILEYINNELDVKRYEAIVYYSPKVGLNQLVSCKPIQYYSELRQSVLVSHPRSLTLKQQQSKQQTPEQTFDNDWVDEENISNEWVQLQNLDDFQSENNEIIITAIEVVDADIQYKVSKKFDITYQFKGITDIQTQVVAGTNYIVVLDYVNSLNQIVTYQVIIYSAPWLGDNQVVSWIQFSKDYQEGLITMKEYHDILKGLKVFTTNELQKEEEKTEQTQHEEVMTVQPQKEEVKTQQLQKDEEKTVLPQKEEVMTKQSPIEEVKTEQPQIEGEANRVQEMPRRRIQIKKKNKTKNQTSTEDWSTTTF